MSIRKLIRNNKCILARSKKKKLGSSLAFDTMARIFKFCPKKIFLVFFLEDCFSNILKCGKSKRLLNFWTIKKGNWPMCRGGLKVTSFQN